MTEHVDPDGTITTYTYDARGLLAEVAVTEPGGTETEIPYPEPDPNQPTTGVVSPIFECWTEETDGTYTAYWGYENKTTQNGQPVGRTIAYGTQNKLTPNFLQGTQPERFGIPGVVPNRPGRTAFGPDAPNAFVTRGWNGSNLVWKLGNKTATASTASSKRCGSPVAGGDVKVVLTETRRYSGDGVLVDLAVMADDVATESALVWDRVMSIPQVVAMSNGADSSVYGFVRESSSSAITNQSALGDQLDTASGHRPFGPFGPSSSPGSDFTYRGELQTLTTVHLRAREMNSSLGTFLTKDRLEGVDGSVTITNGYHYANNDPIGMLDPLGLRPVDNVFNASIDVVDLTSGPSRN
jgi:RHS repeat-associated protein